MTHDPQATDGIEHDRASGDPWAARARPTFLYVMYALLLWSIPLGLLAAFRPAAAAAITRAMAAYLAALPEPLYALFGTGYLGYTVAREWGKGRGGSTPVIPAKAGIHLHRFGLSLP